MDHASPTIAPSAPIVCGVDDSPAVSEVASVAAALATRVGSHLLLLNVTVEPRVFERPLATYEERRREAEEFVRAGQMQVVLRPIEVGGAHVTRAVEFGLPSEALAAVAEKTAATLLVVGGDRTGPLDRMILGSTTLALFRESPCPLVVVPPGASLPAGESIVCGVDGSDSALSAARTAAELARRLGVRLVLVNAQGDSPVDGHAMVQAAETAGEQLAEESIEAVSLPGQPAEVVGRQARDLDAMLIAVGTRGRGVVRSALLGSVSDGLVKTADRPVVVVPARDGRAGVTG